MAREKKESVAKPKKAAKKKVTKAVEVIAPTPVHVAPVPPPPAAPQLTESQMIWEEIRGVQLNMFALPNQTVEMYCKMYPIEPTRCYVTVKVSAVLAALEDNLGKAFNFDTAGKFVLITRK